MPKSLGNNLKEARKKKGLSIEDLAKATDVTRAYIHRLEKGLSNPSAEILYRISLELDTTVGHLLGKEFRIDFSVDNIPDSLKKYAKDNDLDQSTIKRLARVAMRDGEDRRQYNETKWRYLHQTIEFLDKD